MSYNIKAFLIFFIAGILFEILITWLFPYSELAGLINFPVTVMLALVMSIAFISLRFWIKTHLKIGYAIIITVQFFFQIVCLPQSRGSIFSQLRKFVLAYRAYGIINYDNFYELNEYERIVFIQKFKDKLPDRFIFVHILNDSEESGRTRRYRIDDRNGKLSYDDKKISLYSTNDTLIMTEYIVDKRIIHFLPPDFITRTLSLRTDKTFISTQDEFFKVDSGSEQLFYLFLNSTK